MFDWSQKGELTGEVERLVLLRQADQLPPVLLLAGYQGIGKRYLAAATAAAYVCDSLTACGQCDPCQSVVTDRHEDVVWCDPEVKALKLEDAMRLQEHLSYNPAPARNGRAAARIAVISDCDRLNVHATNRLLKILEEPPPQARFVLTTSRFHGLLPTLKSRCVKISVHIGGFDQHLAEHITPAMVGEFAEILAESDRSVGVERLQTWQKAYGLHAADLVRLTELALNRYYKEQLVERTGDLDPVRINRRRRQLSAMKRIAMNQQVTLNASLSAESLITV